ncbi:unnamed protein product, partial [Adineta ricciae]
SAGNDGRLRTFHTILDNLSRCFGRTTRYRWEMELNEDDNDNDDNSTEQALPIVDLRCEVIKENDWDGIIAVHEDRRRVSAWNFIRATRSQHKFEHERFATKVYHNVEVFATSCDISPCGNFCIIGYSTGHIDLYNMQSGLYRGSFDDEPVKYAAKNPRKRLKSSPYATAHSYPICGVSFDSLNTRLISCDISGNIKLWRLKTKTLLSSTSIIDQEMSSPGIKIIKMIVHRDSGLIALAFNNQMIKIYDFDTMTFKCIRTFSTDTHTKEITALAFMPDARWLLSTSLDKTMKVWDIPSGQLIDAIEFDQAIITLAVSPNGDMLATGHTEALGVYLWSNRSMFGGPNINLATDHENQQVLVGEFESPEQISKNLITLSALPESKWKNLLVLDTIRQRNKPKEPISIPKQAPFFLPTVSNLRGFVFVNPDDEKKEKGKNQSHINQIQRFLYESSFTNQLDHQKQNSSFSSDVIQLLKDLGMAKIEYELRCLSPDQGGSLERMLTFIDVLHQAFDNKQNYDLISSYLALFIQLHGTNLIWKNEELIEKIRQIQLKQKETWNHLQRQLNTSIALVKYIKITGAGNGIGKRVAQLFASQGSRVCGVDVQKWDSSCEHSFVSDISQRSSVVKLADEIYNHTQAYPNIIVNAAGILRDSLLLKMREEDFDDVIRVNLKGTFLVNQIFCQRLIAQKQTDLKASVINIASIVGKYGNVGQCNYTASKAGVEAMTKTMAKELGRLGIRTNAVLPGFIQTAMTDKIPDKIKEKLLSMVPMTRMGTVDEIAQVCLFLASNQMSSYVNGASIEVTGGL